ncbi:MAG: sensor histidine kinase [Acidimicrobiales bacterium]
MLVALRRTGSAMPLRSRLVVLLVFFVAVALAVTDAITFTSLQGSLTSQVDQQLAQISRSQLGCNGVPFGTYFNQYGTNGHSVLPVPAGFNCKSGAPLPKISTSLVREAVSGGGLFTTVGSSGQGWQYRVYIQPFSAPQAGPTVLAIAVPLTGVAATLGQQLRLELIVSLLVLAALALAAWAVVRMSTRPLARMSKTAGEIAAGDLTRRVAPTDERTEVGQLGAALNVMLGRIEEAFNDKEATEERLRRFVADASHELRTPLTSLRGYAELFHSGLADRPDDLAAALKRIESESARMARLIDDLLLLARLDRGRPISLSKVNLSALISDAVSDARAIDPSRAVAAVVPPELSVVGDEQRLRQLLGNLVNNALAHTPAGSPVEVTARETPPSGADLLHTQVPGPPPGVTEHRDRRSGQAESPVATATVTVADHGPGIAAIDRPRAFERFWRADQSRGRGSGGSGLGLAIVAAIVGAHDGRVWVEETPGGGASFVVDLPIFGPVAADKGPSFTPLPHDQPVPAVRFSPPGQSQQAPHGAASPSGQGRGSQRTAGPPT